MSEAKSGLAKRGNVLPATDGGVREFLAFELSAERYALPLACVREIMRVSAVTEVPRAPSDVLGVISVRGQVTTVLDLRRKLHLPESPISARAASCSSTPAARSSGYSSTACCTSTGCTTPRSSSPACSARKRRRTCTGWAGRPRLRRSRARRRAAPLPASCSCCSTLSTLLRS